MVAVWGVVAAGCDVDDPVQPPTVNDPPALAVDREAASPARSHLTHWSDLSDDSLWAHIQAARGLVDVGLRPVGRPSGMDRGRLLLSRAQQGTIGAAIRAQPGVEFVSADTLLPVLKLRLTRREAVSALRRLPHVEYVEPGAFTNTNGRRGLGWNDIEFGCSVTAFVGPAGGYIAPGDVLPWNYKVMQIDSAWFKSNGAGQWIGIVDTGVDERVAELNQNFSTGMGSARTILKEATRPNLGATYGWSDSCGHGTRMASVIGAPRNGLGMLGVAWGASLHAIRVDNDVILTEVEATRLGIRRAATTSRVIAMAFGTYAHYSSIAQELSWWYYNSDRVFFAAAGTTACWDPFRKVTFPGTLSTVLTVTGFDQNGLACNSAYGPEVDFAAYTNQPAQGLHTLGSTLAGLHGSSGATAVLAGMAGLYFAWNPGASRDTFISALTYAASPSGGRSPMWGFGVPNAMCLLKEMCTAWIEGPNLIQTSGTYTWTVRQAASPGPIAYRWGSGETTQSITRYVQVYPGMLESAFVLNVNVRDTRNGRNRNDARLVVVRDPYNCPTCF